MLQSLRILLIEDNPADSKLIDVYLREAFNKNYSLVQAESLHSGIGLIESGKFDIIILDLTLPDSEGIDTFTSIHNTLSDIPIIVLTGLKDEVTGSTAVKLGAQDFLNKSQLDSNTLKRSIDYGIERHKLYKELANYAKKIESNEKLLVEAQKIARIGSWEWNISSNVFSCSKELYNILGLTSEELGETSETFLERIHPEDIGYVKEIFKNTLESHKPFSFYHRIEHPNGSTRYMYCRGDVIIENNIPTRIIGIEQDITERKREEELEKLALVATKSYNSVVIADKDGNIEWVNEGFTKLFGYVLEDVAGTSAEVLRRGGKTGLSKGSGIYEALIKKKKPITYENRNYTKWGQEYWLLTAITPVLDDEGDISKLISIDSNITSQKEAEQHLRDTSSLLTQLIDNLMTGVIYEDEQGKIVHINNSFIELFNLPLTPQDIIGKNGLEFVKQYNKFFAEPQLFVKHLKEILEKRKLVLNEELSLADGRTIERNYVPIIIDNNYRGNLWLYRDFTDRKKVEKQLIREKELAEELMKAKEQFLANMSHEIRTPMNAIIGLTQVLLKTDLNIEQRDYLNIIKTSGDTLLVVINDILDLSKIEAGRMTFEETSFNLYEIIASIIELFHPKAEEKQIALEYSIAKNVPFFLMGDPVRLNQILMNLVSNAIKFTEEGKVSLRVRIKEETRSQATVEFVVEDTGIGIPEEKLLLIFESFTQSESAITRKYGGTGLGLSISKRLIELQGGKIEVQSIVNQGSTFSFFLNFKKVKDGHKVIEEKEEDDKFADPLKNLKVLLVEDNLINQLLVEKILGDKGCLVEKAENGKIALEKLSADNKYDIVLMDVKMPEMDGYETTKRVRSSKNHTISEIPILAMTAHATIWEAEKCIKIGMDDYIAKPFNVEELQKKIIRLVNKKGAALLNSEDEIKDNKQFETYKNSGHSHINLDYLKSISKGNDEFMLKIINTFINETPKNIKMLSGYAERKDWEQLQFLAHKMKPSIAFMGIKELEQPIKDIEKYAKQHNSSGTIAQLIFKLDKICNLAIAELENEIKILHH